MRHCEYDVWSTPEPGYLYLNDKCKIPRKTRCAQNCDGSGAPETVPNSWDPVSASYASPNDLCFVKEHLLWEVVLLNRFLETAAMGSDLSGSRYVQALSVCACHGLDIEEVASEKRC